MQASYPRQYMHMYMWRVCSDGVLPRRRCRRPARPGGGASGGGAACVGGLGGPSAPTRPKQMSKKGEGDPKSLRFGAVRVSQQIFSVHLAQIDVSLARVATALLLLLWLLATSSPCKD